jgi:DNA invertase Pin-like site-specific DNA recombinase
LLHFARTGDTVLVHSMDRLARNLDDLRRIVHTLTGKGRQREGIALAKQRGAYKGRKKALSAAAVTELRARIAIGISKAKVAREFGISRQTLYQYLQGA